MLDQKKKKKAEVPRIGMMICKAIELRGKNTHKYEGRIIGPSLLVEHKNMRAEDLKEAINEAVKESASKKSLYTLLEFSLWFQTVITYTKIYFWDKDLSLKFYILPSTAGSEYFVPCIIKSWEGI